MELALRLEEINEIAKACHEVNRTYCQQLGDFSQPPWELADDWQKASSREGVRNILSGNVTAPAQSHASWMAQKLREGWKYGPVKDAERKEHPCMVIYSELPPDQRAKDSIFFAVVNGMKGDG